jgi:arginase family enzyme
MIDLNDYFNPVSIEKPQFEHLSKNAGFPHNISVHTENSPVRDISKFKIALIGVPEGRNSVNAGSFAGPDAIREQLYRLAKIPGRLKITDLGNMKQGAAFSDTIAGLADIITFLASHNTFPILMGGSSAVLRGIDRSFSSRNLKYTMLAVDPRIDYSNESRMPDSFNYLHGMLSGSKRALDHYVNIGYQTYLNDQQVLNRFLKKGSELIRIGEVRQAMYLTEPLFRDSDVAVIDISAVRQSDAPGTAIPSANGFYGEEICLLARYAGISDSLKVFGIFEINPELDVRGQTAALAAQIIWFFLEGFAQKQYETPVLGKNENGRFIKYHVRLTDLTDDLLFIKSTLTERWWMELTKEDGSSHYVSCSYDDYMKANRNEVPDRWIRAIERLGK